MSGWRRLPLRLLLETLDALAGGVHDEALINVVEQHLQIVLSVETLPFRHILDVDLVLERALLHLRSALFLWILDEHSRSDLGEALNEDEPDRHLLLVLAVRGGADHGSIEVDDLLPRLDPAVSKVVSEHREGGVLLKEAIDLGSHGLTHSSVIALLKGVLDTGDERVSLSSVVCHLNNVLFKV